MWKYRIRKYGLLVMDKKNNNEFILRWSSDLRHLLKEGKELRGINNGERYECTIVEKAGDIECIYRHVCDIV